MVNYSSEMPEGDATGGVIPYRNPTALIAYYCGVFSVIPIVGIFAGIPGIILGFIGLRRRRANPHIKGAVHAWIGVVLGGIMTVLWGCIIIYIVGEIMNPAI